MYYHTLNCGFKTRLSGETDFPCITDARVGQARSYFKPKNAMDYDGYVEALQLGRSYVSDGKSHILDFKANGVEAGTGNSELALKSAGEVKVTARLAAYLPERQDSTGAGIAKAPITEKPYWDIERSRVGQSRTVRAELIFNGVPVDTVEIQADGGLKDINLSTKIAKSGWLALRIYPSSHSNPVFVRVDNQPVVEKQSAEWCLAALEQCWKMKEPNIRKDERNAAAAAYEQAREVYRGLIAGGSK